MAKTELQFNFLGFKKQNGQFRPLKDLRPEDFYSLEDLPDELRQPILDAFQRVLGVRFINDTEPDNPPSFC